jgi:hypothetical protein
VVNPNRSEFTILGGFDGRCFDVHRSLDQSKRMRPLNDSELPLAWARIHGQIESRPVKSADYFLNRYMRHPFYEYRVWAIDRGARPQAILVTRRAEVAGAAAIRIVDFHGDPAAWSGLRGALCEFLEREQAEYIDLYARGDVTLGIQAGGFLRRDSESSVVVPNYFEPFEQRNVELDFAYWSDDGLPYQIFKGDTDQDRPNLQS